MDDTEHGLTEADRRAIAEIRRQLDAEFGPLEEPVALETAEAPAMPRRVRERRAGRHRHVRRRARRRGLAATFVLGTLTGTLLGGTGAYLWLRHAGDEVTESQPAAAPRELPPRNDGAASAPAVPDEVASLHTALDEWIAATRRGDITAQMRFYPPRVPVYYRWRDVPRDAVRAEKMKVFGAARRLDIVTDTPAVEVADDRRTAVARFRKRYVIEGPAVRRRGEVLQEVRWTRTDDGWLIVGERDARVLRSG